jgi:hypothetical protein
MRERMVKALGASVITMSTMSVLMEPYSQRRTVESIRSQSSGSVARGTAETRWSARAYWVTATCKKLRHLVKLEALRSRVTGMRDLMLWISVA